MKKENKGWDYVWLKKIDEGHFLDYKLNIPFSFDIHSAFIQYSFIQKIQDTTVFIVLCSVFHLFYII